MVVIKKPLQQLTRNKKVQGLHQVKYIIGPIIVEAKKESGIKSKQKKAPASNFEELEVMQGPKKKLYYIMDLFVGEVKKER